ncbi:MAG: PqqD family protein [Lachnospiraceae bacterium]|nr:PqqD family protein [Lachnospiraceae bacterium]
MKVKKDFITRTVAGETVIVPTGEAAARFNGMITLNETGAFIWRFLQEAHTKEEVLAAMLEEFEVDEASARVDIEGFTGALMEHGMLEA